MKKQSTIKAIIILALALGAMFLMTTGALAETADSSHTLGNGTGYEQSAETTDATPIARKVVITSTLGDCVELGSAFEVKAHLEGFEGVKYTVRWEYNGGKGWKAVANSNSLTYRVIATTETVNYDWRAIVTIDE